MLEDALELCDGPAAIRWPKTTAPHVGWDETGSGLMGRQVRRGTDVCLLGAGKMLAAASGAAELLAPDGISTTVWDPRVICPLDPAMLADAARHPLVVTVEDGFCEGGFGTAVRSTLADTSPAIRVEAMGVPIAHHDHGKPDDLLSSFGLDAEGVAERVRRSI